jgi:hypothetical protein
MIPMSDRPLISLRPRERHRIHRMSVCIKIPAKGPGKIPVPLLHWLRSVPLPADTDALIAALKPAAGPCPMTARLPGSRRRVLDHLIQGHGRKAIAVELKLSEHTVNDHVKAVYRHFGVNSQAALMRRIFLARR